MSDIKEPKKRSFFTLELSPELREEISKNAIKKGLTSSDYARIKLFAPDPIENDDPEQVIDEKDLETALSTIRENNEKISEMQATIQAQSGKIMELESVLSSRDLTGMKRVAESDFLIPLTPIKREIIDTSIKLEAERFFGEEYKHLMHYLYKKLGDIVGSNSEDLPSEFLEKGTPKNIELKELIEMLKGGAK